MVVMAAVADERENRNPQSVRAVLCVDRDAFDRFGRVLRHLLVGLVDQAVGIRLLSDDPRLEALTLGPIRALWHEPITWPAGRRRIHRIVQSLSPQPPTVVHALSVGSYRLADAMAAAFDADLVLQVSSLAACDVAARMADRHRAVFVPFSGPVSGVLGNQPGIDPDRISLIRPGVLASRNVACFAKPSRATTILCTSSFERDSGVDLLLESVDVLRQKGHSVVVFLLGRGRQERALRHQVSARGLSAWVTFANPLGDPLDAMEGADLFIRPSADTAFTVDALQAMGAGLATVTFTSPVCDYFQHDKTAVVCTSRTARALADAIETLLLDRSYAQRLAHEARDYVRSHHAMSAMAERTATLYRKQAMARSTFSFSQQEPR